MQEIWKPVVGYEGLYEVSNLSRIRSLPRNTKNQYKLGTIKKCTILNTGYYYVNLYKNKHSRRCLLHRIVAEAFIPNPSNFPCVNHKDGNKLNNDITNLEWCTYSYNEKHAFDTNLKKSYKKKVNQYTLDGVFIKTWNSIAEANKFYNTSHISECCNTNSKRNITKGYLWRYADE